MRRVAPDVIGPTSLITPYVEVLFIPLAAFVASMGIAVAVFRVVSLATGLSAGWVPYCIIIFTALVATIATTVRGVFNLAGTLRIVDLFLTISIAILTFSYIPYEQGTLRLFATAQPIYLLEPALAAVLIAWGSATSLTWVVGRILPLKITTPDDEVLEERLKEETELRKIYSGSLHAEKAREHSERLGYNVLLSFILFYLVVSMIWKPSSWVRSDATLALWSSITVVAVLAYLALTHLASNRRTIERRSVIRSLPVYASAWGVGVLGPLVVAACLGGLLPANISPLANLDYNDIMSRFTNYVARFLLPKSDSHFVGGIGGSVAHSSPSFVGGAMGGSGGVGPIPFIIVIAAIIGLLVRFWGVRPFATIAAWLYQDEKMRNRGLFATLRALFLWPLKLIAAWFRRSTQPGQAERNRAAQLALQFRQGMRVRRAKRYPTDPALYVRYMYGRMLKSAAEAGFGRSRNETAIEYAQTLNKLVPEAEMPVDELTQTYCDIKYQAHVPAATIRTRVVGLYRSITRYFRHTKKNKGNVNEVT